MSSRSASEVDFLKSAMEYRLILSLGTKGSGKSFCLCNYLRTCFKYVVLHINTNKMIATVSLIKTIRASAYSNHMILSSLCI